jgi:ribosomal protein S21
MEVIMRDGNIEEGIRTFKRKTQEILGEVKLREFAMSTRQRRRLKDKTAKHRRLRKEWKLARRQQRRGDWRG